MAEKYLDRREAAAFLAELGFKYSRHTLGKLAVQGGGPEYQMFGNRAVYLPSELEAWALARLKAPRHSTSEAA